MSGKPETQVPFGHLNLPQCPVGVVVRFSKAAALDSITATAETQTDRRNEGQLDQLTEPKQADDKAHTRSKIKLFGREINRLRQAKWGKGSRHK